MINALWYSSKRAPFLTWFFHNNGEISRHRKNVSIVVKINNGISICCNHGWQRCSYGWVYTFHSQYPLVHCCQLGHYHWTFPMNVSPSALELATRGRWIIIDKRAATLCFPCYGNVWLTFVSLPSLNSIIGRGPVVNVSQAVILTDNVHYKLSLLLLHLLSRRSAGEIQSFLNATQNLETKTTNI